MISQQVDVPGDIPSERFRFLVDAIQDYGIFMLNPDGIVMSWNLGASRLKGYSAEEVIGKHFSRFYPETARLSRWPDQELQIAAQKGVYEEEGWRVRKDGSMFWANVVITALRDEDGTLTGFGKVTRDLTQKHENEEDLRQSEERFRLLVEGVRDYAIYMLDPDGVIQSWNGGAQLIKGYAAQEVIGKHYSMFFRPEDRAAALPAKGLRDALAEGRTEVEGWRLRKDGSSFLANIVMTPIYSPAGILLGYAKVTRDITERGRMRELENSSKRTNEFLSMLGQELRNPNAPIHSAVSILQPQAANNPEVQKCIDVIERQLARMTHLVEELLDAGKLTSGTRSINREMISFNDLAATVVKASHTQMDRSRTFELEMPADRILVNADATRLGQTLQHLLNNTKEFTPPGGVIKLAASVMDGRLHVEISDSGGATSSDDAEMDFDDYSELDGAEASRQSGLAIGLSLARSLVEMHGGSISAFSKGPGKGSVFRFDLPDAIFESSELAELAKLALADERGETADV